MDGVTTILNIFGAVALLLWGVRMVRTGLTRAFGATLRKVIGACSKNRFTAFGGGIALTALLQSSTATALLVASFASRGLITLSIAIAVMLGANVGTTLTSQVLSFNLNWLSPLAIAIGVISFLSGPSDKARHLGRVAIGLGLMLMSLQLLSAGTEPLRTSQSFIAALEGMQDEYVIAVLIGALATWAVHSSLSIVLLVMSFAASGIVHTPIALALVIGANIGGAWAPYMDQSPTDPEARRVPLANLITRVIVGIAFLPLLLPMVRWLALVDPVPARMAVNFHTLFSLVAAVAFLPFTEPMARLVRRLVPDRPVSDDPARPRHLDSHVLDTPAEALACAMRETLYLGDRVGDMLRETMNVFEKNDEKGMKSIAGQDDVVDHLYEAIKLYLVKVSRNELGEEESRRYIEILSFTTNLEHIGDIIDKNLMELAAKKIKNNWTFSAEGMAELKSLHARVYDNLRLSMNVFTSRDLALARRLVSEKTEMREIEAKAADSHFARLREGRPESIETSTIHIDVIRDLKRINGHLTSVAYPILDAAGELADTRLKESQPLMRAPAGS
jgi:phosphate:Na+ symporter